ncbi:MAG: Serine/threonine-protein phosphatase 2A activator 1 [Trizodia sp. TS-e1964]|nr:MAG: Serine/threonine-protein phosphatase 2A activator 1 [Trizodia sp. TS-e1964]
MSFNNPQLPLLDPTDPLCFITPVKRIHNGQDVSAFLESKAYSQIIQFINQLNHSMYPRLRADTPNAAVKIWDLAELRSPTSDTVSSLKSLLSRLEEMMSEAPPDPGPRRFGNVSFRKWYELLETRLPGLLAEFLPAQVMLFGRREGESSESPGAKDELASYLLGSFGSPSRLDYGTGHELSFLAFLGSVWMLGGFDTNAPAGVEERGIVMQVFEPYLNLIRNLIKTYTLEPAGSHGVWGLDDHFFLPYIFGSAQLSPAMRDGSEQAIASEGCVDNAPPSAGISDPAIVARERKHNMYFSAVGFIYDVKTGPFWEHSRILYDVSGVPKGWAKINKGMMKMFNAEVLGKFPVVQHFPFGALFSFERDPLAIAQPATVHHANFPAALSVTAGQGHPTSRTPHDTRPVASASGVSANAALRMPPPLRSMVPLPMEVPWANAPLRNPSAVVVSGSQPEGGMMPTRAPWAKPDGEGPTTVNSK